MARKLRIQYPGAVYHVMNCGDRRESIFNDDADRQRFIETLGEACGKTVNKGVSLSPTGSWKGECQRPNINSSRKEPPPTADISHGWVEIFRETGLIRA